MLLTVSEGGQALTELEKTIEWLKTYPDFNILETFQCDYTDHIPSHGAIFPSGIIELSRVEDILGNQEIRCQSNFGLYYSFEKSPGDDSAAMINSEWIMGFQKWVQEQSATHKAPIYGDEPYTERIQAQNGILYDADQDGVATYMVQLSVTYTKIYEVM